jgi:hypothetical protein
LQALDGVPGQVWSIAAIAPILVSAYCQVTDRRNWALFIGQWAPTFLAIGLYHKLVRPGDENMMG